MKCVANLFKLSCLGVLFTLTACGSSPKDSSGRYSGGYEYGEEAYAEREAARLNRQQSFRLKAGGLFR
ncbi:hypothetical protein OURE66S_00919 [Oligella ureolytica]|jgi:hypothetical protein|nr:hypothetical protein [Alcaligenaceae bacterium]HZJ97694.1 hypothetical protein [Oligella sp.]